MHTLITDSAHLKQFCEQIASDPYLMVDTEFMREKTYYPELCLIQIAGVSEAVGIDPLAKGLDLSPLYALLSKPGMLKVFHACRQDMEIFHQKMGVLPAPIFDTQIAAMVCGFGESVGYEALVNRVLNLPVDKSSRFTDWSRRPLTEKQIDYAMNDVLHLRDIYLALKVKLEASGRASWTLEEMQELMDPAIYTVEPEDAWRKLRLRQSSPRYLALVQAVAKWREETARERNVPRGRVMKDETLAEVAHAKPHDMTELQAIRGFYPTLSNTHYDALFASLSLAEKLPSSECPSLPNRPVVLPAAEALADLLRLLLKACAAEHQVVPRVIADKDEIDALAMGERDGLHALTGWRREVFGARALDLLAGKIALKADGRNGIAFMEIGG